MIVEIYTSCIWSELFTLTISTLPYCRVITPISFKTGRGTAKDNVAAGLQRARFQMNEARNFAPQFQ